MQPHTLAIIGIIAANVLFSVKGFKDRSFFNSYLFSIPEILRGKQYFRLFTSAFLHVDWTHLLFNMFALYSFGGLLFQLVGGFQFYLIYFISLLGGGFISLLVNRHKNNYSAVGASGAVSGVIFACIALYPDVGIYMFFIPIEIPGWVFGPAFILISIFGMQRQSDNIGHEAHLGGAIVGMVVTVILQPYTLQENLLVIAGIFVPTVLFAIYLARKPQTSGWVQQHEQTYHTIDDEYNAKKQAEKAEIDRILDKANTIGWEKLNKEEIAQLNEYAERNK